jgi:hypothetical protein
MLSEGKVKSAVRERDGDRCTDCSMSNAEHKARFTRGLQVHRLKPGSAYTVDGCITLCRPCHWTRHRAYWAMHPKSRHGRKKLSPSQWRQIHISRHHYELLSVMAKEMGFGGRGTVSALSFVISKHYDMTRKKGATT